MMQEVARGQPNGLAAFDNGADDVGGQEGIADCLALCLLFIHPPAHGSEVSPAARNTLDSARIPRASKLLICGLFLKGRVLAQDGVGGNSNERQCGFAALNVERDICVQPLVDLQIVVKVS